MYFKVFLNSLLVLILVIFQISFVSALPGYFSNINILLIFLVYVLIISDIDTSLAYALAFGLLLDILSFYYFGVYLSGFVLSIIIVNFLLVNFFTNRSLHAFLALITSATILNFLIVTLINNIVAFFLGTSPVLFNKEFFLSVGQQLFMNLIIMFTIFYLTNFLSNSFRPVFLVNKKK